MLRAFFGQMAIKNIGISFNQIETNVTENDILSVRSSNHQQHDVLNTITSNDFASDDRVGNLRVDFGQEEQIYRSEVSVERTMLNDKKKRDVDFINNVLD